MTTSLLPRLLQPETSAPALREGDAGSAGALKYAAGGEDEDDIDAYMARLLDRVGGRSKANESGAASAPCTTPAPQEPVVAPEPEVSEVAEMPTEKQAA